MTYIVMAFVLVISAMLQVTLPSCAVLGEVKVPLLLAVVLYYALGRDSVAMLVAAFAAGVLQDALTPMMPLGFSALLFCIAGGVAGLFRRMVLSESVLTSAMFGGVCAFAVTAVFYILLTNVGLVTCPVRRAALKALSSGLLGALCAPVVFAATVKLDGLVGNVEVKESIDGIE